MTSVKNPQPQQSKKTAETKKIEKLLLHYFPNSPKEYLPEAYRYNPASIRLRLVHDCFEGKSRTEREKMVYPILEKNLPKDTWQDITVALLLAPADVENSLMNREFEHPTPSRL